MTEPSHSRPESDPHPEDAAPLAHHFDSLQQQYYSAKLGMWIFLLTEILFFGGLFCAYAVYRANRPEAFADGHHFLDKPLGAINTVVLIFSSLTMALAVRSAQLGRRGALVGLLGVTALCGVAFLCVKAFEYKQKWDHQLVPGQARIQYFFSDERTAKGGSTAPGKRFEPDREYVREHLEAAGYGSLTEEQLDRRVDNLRSFVGIYFTLTGLHALHVAVGVGVILWLLIGAIRGRYGRRNFTRVDLVGLYWHLVDMIWIYLFPLLYLIH
jgi:cytochrome c oxidase subunit 3